MEVEIRSLTTSLMPFWVQDGGRYGIDEGKNKEDGGREIGYDATEQKDAYQQVLDQVKKNSRLRSVPISTGFDFDIGGLNILIIYHN